MTDAELNERLERLSDEDLQVLIKKPWESFIVKRPDPLTVYQRMAREILDLRKRIADLETQLANATEPNADSKLNCGDE